MSQFKEPDENFDGSGFFNFGEEREVGDMGDKVRGSYLDAAPKDEVNIILHKALGDLPGRCPDCDGFCQHHVLKIRDAFMERAGFLGTRLVEGLAIYKMERRFGIDEPEHLIRKIYDLWGEMSVLYALAEPQDGIEERLEMMPPPDEGSGDERSET
jgi:hypothetical protein